MHSNVKKVYVNPNFNRMPNRTMYNSDPTYTNNHLHVNPNFTCGFPNAPNVHKNINLHSKIYVNPNFIKPQNILESTKLNVNDFATSLDCSNSIQNNHENSKQCKNIPTQMSSKSRYHLVRKNDYQVLVKEHQVKESCTTIKINKYKSIPFKNFKNNLQLIKNEVTFNQISSVSKPNTTTQHISRDSFKKVSYNSKPIINSPLKSIPKPNSVKTKKYIDLKLQLKLKVASGVRKKNNIPCRLFTKYGKCLRNIYGTCKYLHDKKHLSICRKFIKGICHDKECLLSHELSTKKMPTCYFYLKGMCTKDDCPYLHVKLNEKSNICVEFLKGYCEKGDKCLQRHVNSNPSKIYNKKLYALNKQKVYGSSTVNTWESVKNDQCRSASKEQANHKTLDTQHENLKKGEVTNEGDCRYFKDLQNEESTCEVLKPTRCKLGTLPSFIHL